MGKEEKSLIDIHIACACSECEEVLSVEYDYDEGIALIEPCEKGCSMESDKGFSITGADSQYKSIIEIIKKQNFSETEKSKLLNDIELDYMINWK